MKELNHKNSLTFFILKGCKARNRNRGLWIADREGVGGLTPLRASSIYTRQNSNGTRYGYACTEERDYYPYWHPSPWRDIAVLTDNPTLCTFYQSQSEVCLLMVHWNRNHNIEHKNVVGRGLCMSAGQPVAPNNQQECTNASYTWVQNPGNVVSTTHLTSVPQLMEFHSQIVSRMTSLWKITMEQQLPDSFQTTTGLFQSLLNFLAFLQ